MKIAFLDRDALAGPGPWINSVLSTNRRIVSTCLRVLETHPAVIVAGPVRCLDWLYLSMTLQKSGAQCHCIGLTASSNAIEARRRALSRNERDRSREMVSQGYGQRPFRVGTLRTDHHNIASATDMLVAQLSKLQTGVE
ncbi:MAG: hypothetical protein AAFR73_00825 [Pseudomonadota bacterium]